MFVIKIQTGNAAMETAEDVAGALETVAAELRSGEYNHLPGGAIRDRNGNAVGTYEERGCELVS